MTDEIEGPTVIEFGLRIEHLKPCSTCKACPRVEDKTIAVNPSTWVCSASAGNGKCARYRDAGILRNEHYVALSEPAISIANHVLSADRCPLSAARD